MRIIAVDDEKIALDALSNAIKAIVAEDEVISFRYPEDALEYARENLCDIAFLDVEMAGMSGVELAQELIKYNSEINIVFCTGYGDYRENAFEDALYLSSLCKEVHLCSKKITASDEIKTAVEGKENIVL